MINNSIARTGNFTSSEIVALTKKDKSGKGFGAPAITYIEECNMERRLGRSLTEDISAKPLTWGKLLEGRAFEMLGLEYTLCSQETITHPNIPYWAGSRDGGKDTPKRTVVDIKCPITLKSFCQLVDAGLAGGMAQIREDHKDGEKYYWQIVSNAILWEQVEGIPCDRGELIVYMPFKSELPEIRMMAQSVPPDQLSKHYWISMSGDDDLPFIKDNGYYGNVNVIGFDIPKADKDALTANVLKAGEMLIGRHGRARQLSAPDDSLPYAMILEDANALKI